MTTCESPGMNIENLQEYHIVMPKLRDALEQGGFPEDIIALLNKTEIIVNGEDRSPQKLFIDRLNSGGDVTQYAQLGFPNKAPGSYTLEDINTWKDTIRNSNGDYLKDHLRVFLNTQECLHG